MGDSPTMLQSPWVLASGGMRDVIVLIRKVKDRESLDSLQRTRALRVPGRFNGGVYEVHK